MLFSDYVKNDAVGLGELVSRREASPGELLDAALAQTARVNPKINAVVRLMDEEAKKRLATPSCVTSRPSMRNTTLASRA